MPLNILISDTSVPLNMKKGYDIQLSSPKACNYRRKQGKESLRARHASTARENVKTKKKYLSKEHRELEYRIWLIDEGVFVQYTGYWIGWSILHICHSFLLESWLLSFLAINTKLSNSKLRECIFLLRISANLIIVIFKEIFLVDFKHYPKHYVKMA